MYIQHFGLAQYPFSLTPNTHYFLKLPSHQKAFELLIKSLADNNSFGKITGEVGTGKTMLCRKVLGALETHKERFITAYIPHPILDEEGFLHALADEIELESESETKYYDLLKLVSEALLQRLNTGKSVILFIDESQAMPEETLATVHLLTKLESVDGNRLRVILFGQPELDELLDKPSLQHLINDESFSYYLPALNRQNTEAYVNHRLNKAGYNGSSLFTNQAFNELYQGSKGIPRLINILSHKAMMAAYGLGDHAIDDKHIKRAIADTETARNTPSFGDRLFAR